METSGYPTAEQMQKAKEGKILMIRKPPWPCPNCRKKTISQFKWLEKEQCFEATCVTCSESVYS